MKMIGSFQTAARLSDSCTTPWLDAPSPKKAMTTRSVRRRRAASAAPLPMGRPAATIPRSEEHTSELQSHSDLVCRLLLEKKKQSHKRRDAERRLTDKQEHE